MRLHTVLVVLLGSALVGRVASACSPANPIPSPRDLVDSAEVIVWARARERSAEPGQRGGPAGDRSKVEFVVMAVLKGKVGSPTITWVKDELTP
jgi:hypothetical protein